jgi:GNAT superfamily N-acetyltransferase
VQRPISRAGKHFVSINSNRIWPLAAAPLRAVHRFFLFHKAIRELQRAERRTLHDLGLGFGDLSTAARRYARTQDALRRVRVKRLGRGDVGRCVSFGEKMSITDVRRRFGHPADLADPAEWCKRLPAGAVTYAACNSYEEILAVANGMPGDDGVVDVAVMTRSDLHCNGLGSLVLRALLEALSADGYFLAVALTDADNEPARLLLRKCGFRPSKSFGHQKEYIKALQQSSTRGLQAPRKA